MHARTAKGRVTGEQRYSCNKSRLGCNFCTHSAKGIKEEIGIQVGAFSHVLENEPVVWVSEESR